MLIGLPCFAVALFILAPVVVPIITPGFSGPKLEQTIELTRIMLLSPIFLAMGAVATSVLNAERPVRRGRDRAGRLQPRDHRRRAHPGPERSGWRAWRSSVVAGSLATCWSRSGRWPGWASGTTHASSWPTRRRARRSS